MAKILVFYGSYRSDRLGIRLADYTVAALLARGDDAELVDAKAVDLPMLDRMYKEHAPGGAPPAMEALARRLEAADAFVFVVGEYNWSVQPGLKNLADHFLEQWFFRPAAILSYSSGRAAGVRAALAWRGILSEMGMVVISSSPAVGSIAEALDEQGQPQGPGRRGAGEGVPALRRRPRLVDAGGCLAAGATGSSILIAPLTQPSSGGLAVAAGICERTA